MGEAHGTEFECCDNCNTLPKAPAPVGSDATGDASPAPATQTQISAQSNQALRALNQMVMSRATSGARRAHVDMESLDEDEGWDQEIA